MTTNSTQKPYDLEDGCLVFARNVRDFCKSNPQTMANREYFKQILRSSASIGANYIEANEKLSKKDFLLRAKIAKKEAKETKYWLMLIESKDEVTQQHQLLIQESQELMNILGSIIVKSQQKPLI